jgi:hypothetical protein
MKQSLKQCPTVKVIRAQQSVKLAAHVDNKVSEFLGSFSQQRHFLFIAIKYKRLKHWLKYGVKFDSRVFSEIDNVLPKFKKTLNRRNGGNT